MTNSSIEYQIKRKKFYESKCKPDHRFKTLTQKWKTPKIREKKLLPDLTLYPKDWTYLVSNEVHPHTITLAELRKKKLKSGDKIYFERGQIYNFAEYNVTVNDVTFGAYGSGVDPIFRGSDTTTTFTSETGGYYSMPLATAPLWVVNPASEMARQGETAWITSTAVATSTTLTGTAATLNAFNSVEALANNAKLRHKEFNFRMSYEHLVTGYNTGTGVLTIGAGGVVGGASGLPFKLYGQKQYATLEGDWWYDDANNELWIKTASDPTGLGWRVITEDYAFNVQSSNVTIENIEFTQYFESAIEAPDSPTLTLSNIYVHDNRQNGIMLYGNNTTVSSSNITIERVGLNAVHVGAVGSWTGTNTVVDEIGEQANIGWPVDTYWIKTGGCAVAMFWDSGETVKIPMNCDLTGLELTNLGYMGVLAIGDNHDISEFIVDTFCTKWNDGGGMYTIHRASLGASTKNIIFSDGIITGGIGGIDGIGGSALTPAHAEGMYTDNGSELITWDNVTCYENSDFGALVNWDTQKTTIQNCTIVGNFNSQICYRQDVDAGDSPVFPNNDGNVLTGNIIVSRALQYCVEVVSYNNDANYNPFSDSGSASNNTYVRPYGTVISISRATNGGNPTAYTLATWITKYSVDSVGSTEVVDQAVYISPHITEDEVAIVTNPTDATVSATIPSGREDVFGNALSTSEDIPAWSSLVYLPQTWLQPDLFLDTFTAANGTNISGRSPNVGPVPNIIAGTHTISSNSLICSVGGVVSWNLGTPNLVWTDRITVTNLSDGFFHYGRMADTTTSAANRIIVFITSGVARIWQNASTVIAETPFTAVTNKSYLMSIVYNGANVRLYMDGALILEGTVTTLTGNYFGILNGVNRTTDNMAASSNVF